MTENRRYHLRLKSPFAWFDSARSQMFHNWGAGAVVTDPAEIEMLESIHAPTERIYEGEFKR
jgi:hypothetical protein